MTNHISNLSTPVVMMNYPITVDNREINNVLMEEFAGQKYNLYKAFTQWQNLYKEVSREAVVYLLPSQGNFQDLTFVANIGCHLKSLTEPTVLIANFKSRPRVGEEKVGKNFLAALGYTILESPYYFEGEADLKFVRDNIYFGGYGIRTDVKTYYYLMDNHEVNIIPIKMTSERNYHFDCLFLPLCKNKALVSTRLLHKKDVKLIEKVVEILDVPIKFLYDGWTNSIILGKKIIHEITRNQESEDAFCKTTSDNGFEPILIDISEFELSGASASCMLMKLN